MVAFSIDRGGHRVNWNCGHELPVELIAMTYNSTLATNIAGLMMSLNRKIGMIDATLFLIFWSITGMASATYWYGALPIIVFILISVSALVAWRGAKSVEKIKNEKATNRTLNHPEGAIRSILLNDNIFTESGQFISFSANSSY